MIGTILGKLLSESLLSFYPIFVKYINIPLFLQIASRFIAYSLISLFFIDYTFLYKNLFTPNALLLSLITLLHVYTSYKGFQLLESGIAYVLFYTYPIFILLMSGAPFQYWILISLVGVYLLSSSQPHNNNNTQSETNSPKQIFKNTTDTKERFMYEGVVMILLAALTEAMIYFLVRRIKTDNHWNHMFLSYGLGAILFFVWFFRDIINPAFSTATFSASMGINLVIGLFGYLMRFYAMTRLDTTLYSSLSYFGIFMSYVYGIVFGGDTITPLKMVGTSLVLLPSFITLFMKNVTQT
jgi:drug/metabolite transporter (DMT)-like permease